MVHKIRFISILLLLFISIGTIEAVSASYDYNITWTHLSTKDGDIQGPEAAEQTASLIIDVDRDGLNDFIIGSRNKGSSLFWFKKDPAGWKRYLIEKETLPIEAGGTFYDIDGDGDQDIVFGGDWQSNKVWWWENPYPVYGPGTPWKRYEIKNSGANQHHDQIFGDFDGDGKAELVFWNQNAKKLFLSDIPTNPKKTQVWPYKEIWSSGTVAEGLGKGDIDKDGKVDLIAAGRWFKHTGGTNYIPYLIDDSQRNSRIALGDLKQGGNLELVMVPGDKIGRLKWYECKGNPKDPGCWVGHDLLGFDVDHGHSLAVADINNDGKQDIFAAEMRLKGGNPDAKNWMFFGDGNGLFQKKLISEGIGNHESRLGDLDGDSDIDILGKPYNWDTPRIDIWLNSNSNSNNATDSSTQPWNRQLIDTGKSWRAVFVTSGDMDNDGNKDIITGGWWYKNPGIQGKDWKRYIIGQPLNNMATVYDFDNDGDLDVLGTTGKGSDKNSNFVWGRNDGQGKFTILNNIEPGNGDFLQGVAVARFRKSGPIEIALSWHEEGKGIQMLTLPSNPSNSKWQLRQISATSQDEGLSQGDIDRDGDIDLLLGTKWLDNNGGSWKPYTINTAKGSPDRNKLADINGDGRLDAVVGFEAVSIPGKLAWYEQGSKVTSAWAEHLISNVVGPMSLDVADIDNDGDMDVVVGEHNLKNPSKANLFLFENSDGKGKIWDKHVIYTGDEHHDGAQTVDIDNDGDLDIISIGWGHGKVILYKNKGNSDHPVISSLLNQKVKGGRTAKFSVVATGTAPLKYQWQKNGVNITGATTATYITPPVTLLDNGSTFRVRVTNSAGSLMSNNAILTVLTSSSVNLLKNQGFESDTSQWSFYTKGKGTFTAGPPGYEGIKAAKIYLGSKASNIQLYQAGIILEPNTSYRLSFAAYSKTGHDMNVKLLKHVSPYTSYNLEYTANLGTNWKTFTTTFTTKGFEDTVKDGRLMFWFAESAAAGDMYYIDNVLLGKVIGS